MCIVHRYKIFRFSPKWKPGGRKFFSDYVKISPMDKKYIEFWKIMGSTITICMGMAIFL